MALITATEAKTFIPTLSGTTQDTLLDTLIARADAVMATYCGIPVAGSASVPTFEDTTYTEYPPAPRENPRAISVQGWPIVSITSAHVDADWSYGSSTLVPSADLVLDSPTGTIWLAPSSSWAWGRGDRVNRIVYVGGYATAPEDLKQACGLLVAHWFRLRNSQGRQNASGQSGNVTNKDETIPTSVRQILSRWVRAGTVL